jgi:hypothetical protein
MTKLLDNSYVSVLPGQGEFLMTTPHDPDITAEFWGPEPPRRTERSGARASAMTIRLGVIAAVGLLMVPVAVAVRASDEVSPVVYADSGVDQESGVDSEVVIVTMSSIVESFTGSEAVNTESSGSAPVRIVNLPILSAPKQLVAPSSRELCRRKYRVQPGDSWLRIAASGKMKVETLLLANGAQLSTIIHPGRELCVPEGAQMPTPPPAPTTTVRTPTAARTERSSSPTAPAPTPAPVSTATPLTADQVIAMIREIWPAELAERAIAIAYRESRYRPSAYNGWCCYGVFQIYWTVHRSWMAAHGVTSVNQLYDARTNITMAYQIYQRAGGWGPWT